MTKPPAKTDKERSKKADDKKRALGFKKLNWWVTPQEESELDKRLNDDNEREINKGVGKYE